MKTLEERLADLEREVAELRQALAAPPQTCGRELPSSLPLSMGSGWVTKCVLARGHAGQCDPTIRHEHGSVGLVISK